MSEDTRKNALAGLERNKKTPDYTKYTQEQADELAIFRCAVGALADLNDDELDEWARRLKTDRKTRFKIPHLRMA